MSNSRDFPMPPAPDLKPMPEDFDFALAGQRIRQRRLQFGLSTQKVADIAGVARYTVIRLEQGLPVHNRSLQRIRSALHLFSDQLQRPFPTEKRFAVHRAEESRWTVSIPKAAYQKHLLDDDPIHVNDPAERRRLGELGMQPFFTSIMDSELPGGTVAQALMELHQPSWVDSHFGEEFVYCLRGPVVIRVEDAACTLNVGDSMTFDATLPHQYEPGPGLSEPALILVVVCRRPGERRPRPAR